MVIIKKHELNKMDEKVLVSKLEELRKELMKLNAKIAVGTAPENPKKISEIKRTIARIFTKLNINKKKGGK